MQSKPAPPRNYRLVRGNLLTGLPFANDTFDFVHQRFLNVGIVLSAWPAIVDDLMRVTRPGGWIEMCEARDEARSAGPATQRLLGLTKAVAASRGIDLEGRVANLLSGWLRDSGAVEVQEREIALPVGE